VAAQREAERDRRQTEWNSLHYEILQRLVLEIARTSIETQQLSMRIEALSAKVEFAERRARSIEGTLHQARPAPRHVDSAPPMLSPSPQVAQQPREYAPGSPEATAATPAAADGATGTGEGARRRRRRRRGRRPQGFTPEGAVIGAVAGAAIPEAARALEGPDSSDADESDDDDGGPDVPGDEGDSAFTDALPVAEAALIENAPVETRRVPVDVPSSDVATTEIPGPAEAAAPSQAPSTEPVVEDRPDRHQPPDAFGD
jgi:hypothetical protein